MSENKQFVLFTLALTCMIFIGSFFGTRLASHSTPSVGASNAPTLLKTATNAGVSVATSSTAVLAKNTARSHVLIVNDSTNVVYLALGATAVANKGIRLNASGGSYEINDQNLFIGAINAIAVGGTSVVTVVEE